MASYSNGIAGSLVVEDRSSGDMAVRGFIRAADRRGLSADEVIQMHSRVLDSSETRNDVDTIVGILGGEVGLEQFAQMKFSVFRIRQRKPVRIEKQQPDGVVHIIDNKSGEVLHVIDPPAPPENEQ